MTSMNISIKKEAYEFLKERKGDRSFSDAILDFKKDNDLTRFFGCLKDVDWDAREKEMKRFREEFNDRIGHNSNN